jgi:hypothetical protein
LIIKSLKSGRFDKNNFEELGNTIILGEDGGLYVLINSTT